MELPREYWLTQWSILGSYLAAAANAYETKYVPQVFRGRGGMGCGLLTAGFWGVGWTATRRISGYCPCSMRVGGRILGLLRFLLRLRYSSISRLNALVKGRLYGGILQLDHDESSLPRRDMETLPRLRRDALLRSAHRPGSFPVPNFPTSTYLILVWFERH